MRLRSAARRVRGAVGPSRALSPAQAWNAYLAGVEPTVAARPRIHRFAQAPIIGEPGLQPEPAAVWIDGAGEAAARTHAALMNASTLPTRVFSGTLMQALAQSRDERLVLLRAGDEPAPLALERLGQAARLAPDAAVITCDDDRLSPTGSRHSPRFAPGPAPDHWLATDESGAMMLVSRRRAAERARSLAGGPGWRHELAIELAGPSSAGHGHVPMLLCHLAADSGRPQRLEVEALGRVLKSWEPGARVERFGDIRWVRRPISSEPSVEIIICFRDRADLTHRCVQSLLAETDYERFTVTLVDNGSVEDETRSLLARLTCDQRVSVRQDPRDFNFSALNNSAARASDADVLVFLNNDTEVIDRQWLSTLLEEALRPQVGAVAPMLLYPNGTVQHAGAVIGLHGYAGHPFAGLSPDQRTPFGRANGGTRNWLAVSAACMMVERAKFLAVGGFDQSFVVAGNDVDLCLRLTTAGHRSLCVPQARLVHDESESRGAHIDPGDFAASERSYGAFRTLGDPFYNPSLTLQATDCRVRTPQESVL